MTRGRFSLGEGNTPLVRSRWLGAKLGIEELYFKLAQTNPTGSYKDRFAARLIALLVEGGHGLFLATSSGKAGAAMAAYSAAAGIRCVLCVPEGTVSVAGMWQAAQEGGIGRDERVVCLLTGHGFKDEAAARRMAERGVVDGDVVTPEEIDEALLERLL